MAVVTPLTAYFLTDGGQSPLSIAELLAAHVDSSRHTLDLAIYSLKLDGEPGDVVRSAVRRARERGVVVRMVFNQEVRPRPRPLPPPGFVDYEFLDSLHVPSRAIRGEPDLMHHKYAVADAGGVGAAVWTGSANWTNDSFAREENIIVRLAGAQPAAVYRANFDELWETRSVRGSGDQPPAWCELTPALRARPYFGPGRVKKLVHEMAQRIATAGRRVRVCSPVLTSGPVLASLAEALRRPGLDLCGCYDATQMAQVMSQWAQSPESLWKLELWRILRQGMAWGAKRSTPYEAGMPHDFMHAKCVVADDTVFTGSYNLSHSGEDNAENVLEIYGAEVADRFSAYVERLAARYGRALER